MSGMAFTSRFSFSLSLSNIFCNSDMPFNEERVYALVHSVTSLKRRRAKLESIAALSHSRYIFIGHIYIL